MRRPRDPRDLARALHGQPRRKGPNDAPTWPRPRGPAPGTQPGRASPPHPAKHRPAHDSLRSGMPASPPHHAPGAHAGHVAPPPGVRPPIGQHPAHFDHRNQAEAVADPGPAPAWAPPASRGPAGASGQAAAAPVAAPPAARAPAPAPAPSIGSSAAPSPPAPSAGQPASAGRPRAPAHSRRTRGEPVIRIHGLSKDYGGQRGAFDIDLDVHQGEVFGFIGPNGAGKSTTIRCLLGFLFPTAGSASILGLDPWQDGPRLRQEVGYLPGELALWEDRTGRSFLADMARLRGRGQERIDELAQRLGLDLDTRIRALSKGNRQKLGIAQAFMHDPQVLILDEPTDGLDPLLRREVHRLVREASDDGRTVFLSSHVIHEVEQVCDRIGLIRKGRLLLVEELATLQGRLEEWLVVRFASDVPASAFAGVGRFQSAGARVYRFRTDDPDALIKRLAQHPVASVRLQRQDLEEAILYLYREEA